MNFRIKEWGPQSILDDPKADDLPGHGGVTRPVIIVIPRSGDQGIIHIGPEDDYHFRLADMMAQGGSDAYPSPTEAKIIRGRLTTNGLYIFPASLGQTSAEEEQAIDQAIAKWIQEQQMVNSIDDEAAWRLSAKEADYEIPDEDARIVVVQPGQWEEAAGVIEPMARVPFYWHEPTNMIYVGWPGGMHFQLAKQIAQQFPEVGINEGDVPAGGSSYGRNQWHAGGVHQHLGAMWHFDDPVPEFLQRPLEKAFPQILGKSGTPTNDTYHDPHNEWEWRLGSTGEIVPLLRKVSTHVEIFKHGMYQGDPGIPFLYDMNADVVFVNMVVGSLHWDLLEAIPHYNASDFGLPYGEVPFLGHPNIWMGRIFNGAVHWYDEPIHQEVGGAKPVPYEVKRSVYEALDLVFHRLRHPELLYEEEDDPFAFDEEANDEESFHRSEKRDNPEIGLTTLNDWLERKGSSASDIQVIDVSLKNPEDSEHSQLNKVRDQEYLEALPGSFYYSPGMRTIWWGNNITHHSDIERTVDLPDDVFSVGTLYGANGGYFHPNGSEFDYWGDQDDYEDIHKALKQHFGLEQTVDRPSWELNSKVTSGIPAAQRTWHINRVTGRPCYCSYGRNSRNRRNAHLRKTAGPNWNRFKKQIGKKFFKERTCPQCAGLGGDFLKLRESLSSTAFAQLNYTYPFTAAEFPLIHHRQIARRMFLEALLPSDGFGDGFGGSSALFGPGQRGRLKANITDTFLDFLMKFRYAESNPDDARSITSNDLAISIEGNILDNADVGSGGDPKTMALAQDFIKNHFDDALRAFAEYSDNILRINPCAKCFGKGKYDPRAQEFLDIVDSWMAQDEHGYVDEIAPFLIRMFKQGAINVGVEATNSNDTGMRPILIRKGFSPNVDLGTVSLWGQWAKARDNPTREGINIQDPEFDLIELDRAIRAFQEWLREERLRKSLLRQAEDATVVRWSDGWHIVEVTAAEDVPGAMELEGAIMHHCIGSDEQPSENCSYKQAADNGDIRVFSLRDPRGQPHATWHVDSEGYLCEIHGKSDQALKPDYDKRVIAFMSTHQPECLHDAGAWQHWLESQGIPESGEGIQHVDDDAFQEASDEFSSGYDTNGNDGWLENYPDEEYQTMFTPEISTMREMVDWFNGDLNLWDCLSEDEQYEADRAEDHGYAIDFEDPNIDWHQLISELKREVERGSLVQVDSNLTVPTWEWFLDEIAMAGWDKEILDHMNRIVNMAFREQEGAGGWFQRLFAPSHERRPGQMVFPDPEYHISLQPVDVEQSENEIPPNTASISQWTRFIQQVQRRWAGEMVTPTSVPGSGSLTEITDKLIQSWNSLISYGNELNAPARREYLALISENEDSRSQGPIGNTFQWFYNWLPWELASSCHQDLSVRALLEFGTRISKPPPFQEAADAIRESILSGAPVVVSYPLTGPLVPRRPVIDIEGLQNLSDQMKDYLAPAPIMPEIPSESGPAGSTEWIEYPYRPQSERMGKDIASRTASSVYDSLAFIDKPSIVEIGQDSDVYREFSHDADFEEIEDDRYGPGSGITSRPWQYDPESNTIYIGPIGAYHIDMMMDPDWLGLNKGEAAMQRFGPKGNVSGRILFRSEQPYAVEYYSFRIPQDDIVTAQGCAQVLEAHYGLSSGQDLPTWQF